MVTRFSQGVPIIKPISSIDVDFAHQVLVKKQEQYDAGYANMQKMFDAVGGIQLAKENETEYLNNKINQASQNINKMGNIDYSESKLITSLNKDIANVAKDPIVQNAILNKQNYDQLMTRYTKLKENPKLYKEYYSQYNEMEDMETVKKYLNDGDIKAKFRLNTPTFKVDIDKQIADQMSKLMKVKRQRADGEWVYTEEGLTEAEVRNKVRGIVNTDPLNIRQLQINAKWKYQDTDGFMKQNITPLVDGYTKTVKALQSEVDLTAAQIMQLGNKPENKAKIEQLENRKKALQSHLNEGQSVIDKLSSTSTDPQEKKQLYEMMLLENNAVSSFPQSVTQKRDEFSLLDRRLGNDMLKMKQKFGYDAQLKTMDTDEDIRKAKTLDALGLSKKNSDGTSSGGGGVNPVGETAAQVMGETDDKAAVVNAQINNFKEANRVQFTNMMVEFMQKELNGDNQLLESIIKTGMIESNGVIGGKTFEKIKQTAAYQVLDSKVKNALVAQYNAINNAYRDVLDGNNDTNYDSWKFKPEVQGALSEIQLRSSGIALREKQLAAAQRQAGIEEFGSEKKYIEWKNKTERFRMQPQTYEQYVREAKTKGQYVMSRSDFDADVKDRQTLYENTNGETYKAKLNSKLAGLPQFQESSYLINKDAIGKENYGTIKAVVGDAITNGGIYEDFSRTKDPSGLFGNIQGQEVKNKEAETYRKGKDFEVTAIFADAGIARVEVDMGDEGKKIGFVQIKPQAVNSLYNAGLNKKETNQILNDYVDEHQKSPIMLSGTNPPLFFTVDKIGSKYDVKLMYDSSKTGFVHFNLGASNASAAKAQIEQIINQSMLLPEIAALPKTEEVRKLVYDLIVKKYQNKIN